MLFSLNVVISFSFLLVHSAESDCHRDEMNTTLDRCPHLYNIARNKKVQKTFSITSERSFICCPKPSSQLPSRGICGQIGPRPRIVGGSMAAPNEFPWMAMLFYQNLTTFTSISYCAGSLINNRYVLTAAHCVHDLPGDLILKKVRFGEHNISTNPDCNIRRTYCAPRHVEINVESIILHSQLNKSPRKRFENDIALVRLKIPIRYTKEIRPICIEGHYNIPANATFLIAGWGKTEDRSRSEVLMRTTIQNRRPQVCMGEFTNVDFDPRSQICAGGLDGNDTCSGDSGAPLMMFIGHGFDQVVYQVGITSYGRPYCGYRWPAFYTKISAYFNWIRLNIRD